MRLLTITLALLAIPIGLQADLRQPTPQAHAITEINVVTEPGETLNNATVVIRNGLIEAIGTNIDIPADARVIRFERGDEQAPLTLYPGLIESYLPIDFDVDSDAEIPTGRHSLIHPDRTIDAEDWPADAVQSYRAAGFTTALLAPRGGLLAGQSTLANLGDGDLAANRLDGNLTQHGSLHGRDALGGYPQSLMGSVALMRQTLSDARWQIRAQQAWQQNPAQPRPNWHEGLDSLAAVQAGSMPLVMASEDALDTLRVFDMIGGDIDLVIVGSGEEYRQLQRIATRPVPHILPLAFPSAPDVEQGDEGAPDANLNRDVSLEELRHWQRAPENAARMIDAGIPVLLTSLQQSSPNQLFAAIAIAVERGLDADQALAALTTGPARWLGIDDRAGKIAPGYMANLMIVDGDLFTESPTISEVWVDGQRYELTALTPPEVNPAGTWDVVINAGGMGEIEGVLDLSGPPTGMQGSLTIMGTTAPLTEARVSGKQLQIKFDAANFGAAGTISINFDIDGERGRGNGSGPFGDFTLRGQRVSAAPEQEVL
ncbi:MAG: amidohydrolase family protein [Pseudomonadota bacterium]